jgi:hypothetical protein
MDKRRAKFIVGVSIVMIIKSCIKQKFPWNKDHSG